MLVGRVLGGRYRIEEVIGRGGMGAVYRAVDERLGRQVALKVITVAGSDDREARERLRARFFREARSAAAIPHHPNVVPVYDYGSDDEVGLDYLVMELLRGSDLATRLSRSGAPALAASLKILLEAARGIAVGHRQGLIHRDIKPGNIFLAQTHNNEVQVRVVDFGIAKLADDEDTLAQLTQDGRVPHSPAYASPEQLKGLTQLMPASDVFSLGAVGYQLLTGERPFTESDRNKMSLGMAVEAPRLRDRNPAIPPAADAVIQRALAYDPGERFSDAGAMAEALERAIRTLADSPVDPYLAGAPIVTATEEEDDDRTRVAEIDYDDRTLLAPPPVTPPPSRAAPPASRREAVPAAAASRKAPPRKKRSIGGFLAWGLVLLVVGAAIIWAMAEMERPTNLSDSLPGMPDTLVAPESAQVVVEEPAAEPGEQEAFDLNRRGIELFTAGNPEGALELFREAVSISPDNPDYRRNYGVALLERGFVIEAVEELDEAVDLDPNRPLPYFNLARARLAAGDTADAVDAYEDYLARESDAANRAQAQAELEGIQRSQQQPAVPPLLGDTVLEPRVEPVQPATGLD